MKDERYPDKCPKCQSQAWLGPAGSVRCSSGECEYAESKWATAGVVVDGFEKEKADRRRDRNPFKARFEKEIAPKHRRRKILSVDAQVVLDQARSIVSRKPGFQIRGLPDDIEVIDVQYDYGRRAFAFLVCSNEWPEWDPCCKPQRLACYDLAPAPANESQMVLWQRFRSDGMCPTCEGLNARQVAELMALWHEESR